jgi:hypothetical protein
MFYVDKPTRENICDSLIDFYRLSKKLFLWNIVTNFLAIILLITPNAHCN